MAQETRVKVGQKASVKVTESTTIVKKVVIGTPIRNVTQATFNATTLGNESGGFYRDFRNLVNVPGGETGGSMLTNVRDSNRGTDTGIFVRGTQTVAGSIVPDSDRRYNLGTPSRRWGSLYIEGATLYVGDLSIGDAGGGQLAVQPVDADANPTGVAKIIATDVDSSVILRTVDMWARGIDSTGAVTFSGTDSAGGYATNKIAGLNSYFDSSYVQARISSTFLDNLIDSDFIKRNLHEGKVQQIIDERVDSAFVDLLQNPGGIRWKVSGTTNQYRTADEYLDSDRVLHTVRSTEFSGGKLRMELATFTPSVSATGQTLSWDQTASSFSVAVDNPVDITNRWLNSVTAITPVSGSVSNTIGNYNAGNPSPTPAGGVDWTQTFQTDADTFIRSTTANATGGSASANMTFADNNGSIHGTTAQWTTNWSNATVSATFGSLTGNTFLQQYTSIPYTISVGGLSTPSNGVTVVSPTGGSLSSTSASGTMTFTTAVHKDNNSGRGIIASTTFSRPAGVTGSAYNILVQDTDSAFSASFTYPSFRIFTASSATPPTRANIIQGSGFESTVTQLGNNATSLTGTINNSSSDPQCLWFGLRSTLSQPTSFQTGASSSLLSDVAKTDGNVNLEPDASPSGYSAVAYKLYGVTLQPGNTYVSMT